MDLYVITPDGMPVTRRMHAAVLICVKTAALMSAVLALGPLKEEDYLRLVKMALEPKDRLVLQAGCQHPWPCSGKPALVLHDRGKLFTGFSAHGRCWWIALASSPSRRRPLVLPPRGPSNPSFAG